MPSKNGSMSKWICPVEDYIFTYEGEESEIKSKAPYVFGKEWLDSESIEGILRDLKFYGCNPSICIREKKWRFYINSGTTMYDESRDLRIAFRKAFKKWEKEGRQNSNDRTISLYIIERKKGKRIWRQPQWRVV